MFFFLVFQCVSEIGLKTKYFSSEYKKPLCVELEDVKINKISESDLETQRQNLRVTSCEKSKDDDDARYLKWLQESSTAFLNYILQFLPPTAMILLQVTFMFFEIFRHSGNSFLFCFYKTDFRSSHQKFIYDGFK